MTVVAFRTIISDPNLTKNYSDYVLTRTEAERSTLVAALENSIAQIFGSQARGGSEKLVPDVPITDVQIVDTLSKVLGESISETEVKLKRSETRTKASTIGTSKITDLLKDEAIKQTTTTTESKTLDRPMIDKLNAGKGALLFNVIKSDPTLYELFYRKSRFLQLTKQIAGGPVQVTSIFIPKSDFTVPPFKFRYSDGDSTIYISLDDPYEKALLDKVKEVSAINMSEATMDQFIKGFEQLKFKTTTLKTTAKTGNQFTISIPTGGSIPIATNKVKKGIRKSKPTIQKSQQPQKVISDAQITALVRKDVEKRMPKGPLRGPPLSPTVLTYRTGMFVDSIKVIQDLRQNIMTYYYAPNYKIHERRGARAPRLLIQPSIRSVVQDIYSEKFRILRGF
jgi:hypothetical protein